MTIRHRKRYKFLASIVCLLGAATTGCPSTPTTFDGGLPDGVVDSAMDAGDAQVDASVSVDGSLDGGSDSGDGGMNVDGGSCSLRQPHPPPTGPMCSAEASACFGACTSPSCLFVCRSAHPAEVECWDCVGDQITNCGLEWCLPEETALACCRERPECTTPGCPLCDPESAAVNTCWNENFLPHCRAEMEPCFVP